MRSTVTPSSNWLVLAALTILGMPFTIPSIHLNQPKSEVLAYLAGIIDGEGCISLHERKDRRSCHGQIQVQMSNPQAVNLLRDLFGGNFGLWQRPNRPEHADQYKWAATGKRAAVVCETLLPYLRVKKAQALNLIALQKLNKRISAAVNVERSKGNGFHGRTGAFPVDENLYRQGKELVAFNRLLNMRGKPKET